MTHPSIQGLKEAAHNPMCIHGGALPSGGQCFATKNAVHPECFESAQAAYLAEHGVLLSGEGLVRAKALAARAVASGYPQLYTLVPEDGET